MTAGKDKVRHQYDFSFSGLKTAVARYIEGLESRGEVVPTADVAAGFVCFFQATAMCGQQVATGQDAEQAVRRLSVDHDYTSDVFGHHVVGRLAQRMLRMYHHRCARQHFANAAHVGMPGRQQIAPGNHAAHTARIVDDWKPLVLVLGAARVEQCAHIAQCIQPCPLCDSFGEELSAWPAETWGSATNLSTGSALARLVRW